MSSNANKKCYSECLGPSALFKDLKKEIRTAFDAEAKDTEELAKRLIHLTYLRVCQYPSLLPQFGTGYFSGLAEWGRCSISLRSDVHVFCERSFAFRHGKGLGMASCFVSCRTDIDDSMIHAFWCRECAPRSLTETNTSTRFCPMPFKASLEMARRASPRRLGWESP